ncbi:hypothetical protein WKK05_02965 [Nostoc sp. UHCC 0302]
MSDERPSHDALESLVGQALVVVIGRVEIFSYSHTLGDGIHRY